MDDFEDDPKIGSVTIQQINDAACQMAKSLSDMLDTFEDGPDLSAAEAIVSAYLGYYLGRQILDRARDG
jgi:hypothetical protein